ncbi:CMGC/RCK/MAK protein kinase [Microbotryum lychnidis-dioicae p1A1 Lamole]|uniref:CMGC/RCK/MAK protein kinase n=1 Tax=Microbotryum lychnidis-dioicae (strain p1A1 Lamole / MvSl-1064) TaxID=683840 RepID=U5H2D8_USTV1|nr:CMGC/RCK/MAK protein kinase [Microbotryum lychnidis-dioicae p1A1 Lamole]|eukprot:KDE08261.1 CMGC/RCK/MAK protein kinase [Microbotryum lychnidis-dioicae p1A1 Lamole]
MAPAALVAGPSCSNNEVVVGPGHHYNGVAGMTGPKYELASRAGAAVAAASPTSAINHASSSWSTLSAGLGDYGAAGSSHAAASTNSLHGLLNRASSSNPNSPSPSRLPSPSSARHSQAYAQSQQQHLLHQLQQHHQQHHQHQHNHHHLHSPSLASIGSASTSVSTSTTAAAGGSGSGPASWFRSSHSAASSFNGAASGLASSPLHQHPSQSPTLPRPNPTSSYASHHAPRPHQPLHVSSSSSGSSWVHDRSTSNSDSLASGLTSPASAHSTSSRGHKFSPPMPNFPPIARQFLPPLEPRSYTIIKEVGDGSFGTVWLADWHSDLQLPPGTLLPGPSSRPEYKGKRLVAIKRMKKAFEGGWAECTKLKELKSLQSIPMHPNIIPLYDAFLLPSSKELYFVFECMEGNLYQLTKSRKGRPLASGLTASIFEQILAGLDHIHQSGFFHRDMKPENLLITTTGLADYPASSLFANATTPPEKDVVVSVKLADFGLARETASQPPYTEYVSTRWYRAPEVLLRSRDYSNPVDMWALGTIMLEVLTLKPIFPGDSEVDQVFKICEVLGDPSTDYGIDERGRTRGGGLWPRGVKMAKDVGFAFSKIPPRTFTSLFDPNTVSPQMIDCIADLLRYEPRARLTARQCIDHAYFREVAYRYAPYRAPESAKPAIPATQELMYQAPSLNGLTISTTSAVSASIAPSAPSPRVLPPAHGHTPSHYKPPFQVGTEANGRFFPNVDRGDSNSGYRYYPEDSSSIASGMSNYPIHVSSAPLATSDNASSLDRAMMSYPESPSDGQSASLRPLSRSSLWSTDTGDQGWGMAPKEPYRSPASSSQAHMRTNPIGGMGGLLPRRPSFSGVSIAASTFYDGSVFEGITQQRPSSIMSFPVGYGTLDDAPSPTFPDSPSSNITTGSTETNARRHLEHQQQHQQASSRQGPNSGLGFTATPAPAAAPTKSGRWGLGKVFSGDSSADAPAASISHSLKRTPSTSSSLNGGTPMEGVTTEASTAPKTKKELKAAEKASRDVERAKRDAAMQASRERARAVMQKKTQLREAADPLHNFSNSPRLVAPVEKGKVRVADTLSVHNSMSQNSFKSKMPQIVEDTSRLQVTSHKARRRHDDDDVHSVSSGEATSIRGRTAQSISGQSISSIASSASDPERRLRQEQLAELGLTRVPSLSSLNSTTSAPARSVYGAGNSTPGHYTRTGTGHSSLESSLVRQMNGLATSSRVSAERSESRGARASSPRDGHSHHERYSPYPFPNGAAGSSTSLSRQHLGQSPPPQSPGAQPMPPNSPYDPSGMVSGAPSIASFHSASVFQSSGLNPTRSSPPPQPS